MLTDMSRTTIQARQAYGIKRFTEVPHRDYYTVEYLSVG